MITREQIKLFLQNIASSHYNIHTFGWGDVPDLLARENVIYPYMMVTPVPSTFEDGYINYGYLVSIADRIREGNQNEVEVDSDTFNIMMQVITQIDNLLYNDVDLVKGQTITPFMEAHRHRVSGHFSELQIRVKYNYDACAIPSDEVPLPLPPPPSCAVANYRVEYENGTLIEEGTIPSGGSKTIEVPNPDICANATWELRDEDGNLLDSGSVASGGSVTIEAPNADLLIRNSLNQTLYNLSLLSGSSGSQTIGDSSIRLEDSIGTLIANSSVVAEGSATITAPDGMVSVRKSDGVEIYSVDVRSNGTASQNVADSVAVIKDSANTTLKSENIKATESENIVINDSSVENSDASYSVNVLAEGSLILPDSQINVNSVDSGDVVSVKTIDVNITDGVDPVTPTSVGLVGNTLTIEVPSGGGSPSGVLFQTISPRQYTSYRTGDEGWRVQNGWYDYTPPAMPKVVAELDFTSANSFNVLANPLVVNGVSNTIRFVDVDGGQTFSATGNKNLVVIDKLTGMMYNRISISPARNWNACIDDALSYSIVVNSITYDDWYLISSLEILSIFHEIAGVNPEVDAATSVTVLPGSLNVFTSTTYANATTSAKYYERSVRIISNIGKTTTINPIYIRNARSLITAP
jgi:hypothetical protein